MATNNLLAIDGDGVMLDYNAVYPLVWKAAFGDDLVAVRENCYHAHNKYGVALQDKDLKSKFFRAFNEHFWSTMPALPGAVKAVQKLSLAGYRIVCVSSMPAKFAEARLRNLHQLGIPVERVYATGRGNFKGNPKAVILNELKPAAFIDDLLHNFAGVSGETHKALINYNNVDSPNIGQEETFEHDSVHSNLLDFAEFWLNKTELRLAA